METHENEQYIAYPLSGVHDAIQGNIISHEEICEPVDECLLQEGLVEVSTADVDSGMAESEVAVEILADRSDEEEEGHGVYPIYIKQEEQQQYTSGDDESMAVEALRQLGGMYPCFEDKKVSCPNCMHIYPENEISKHQISCTSAKLSCVTCGERFERKMDLNNHTVCHQVDRPHACRTCGNLFRSKSNLRCHMLQVHQMDRPHKCSICGADFQRPSSLSNHMKIHTYVAGRAIIEAQGNGISQPDESYRKWPTSLTETPNAQAPATSMETVQNYDGCQVHWTVPSYDFHSDQSGVNTMPSPSEKMDTLQEFAVMTNGEVAQFEYPQQNNIGSQAGQQYGISLNCFEDSGVMVKAESLTYSNENRRNYAELEGTNESKQHACRHCGICFTRATALTSHEKIHESKNWAIPIECEYCDKQFQDSNHLESHQRTCAKKMMQNNMEQSNSKWGKHACSECGKKFTTKQKMFRHQWIHRKKTHSCEVCGTQFERQNQLDEHRLSAHPGDSPFTCTECGKSFVSRQGLWEHGRTHAGSPAHFHCDTCSKTFSSRQGYLIHHRTHTGERPYGCKFCWKAFRDGGTLRKHERIHTGERPHVCPLCSRAFNQKVVLREHVRWVHAAGKNATELTGPPFPCPICGALNQDRDELCAHIVKHSDQMIAEAKAKTNNNAPKLPKPTRKKSKHPANSQRLTGQRTISKVEENEALLSIAESERQGNKGFLVVEKHNENYIALSERKTNNVQLIQDDKQQEEQDEAQISQPGKRTGDSIGAMIVEKQTKPTNTLHLITKQNKSLPVLAMPNPQGQEGYLSQITQITNADIAVNVGQGLCTKEQEGAVSNQESQQQATVIQVVQYHQPESDNGEELVCGICGEDFNDKNVLMEHVKIHI
ncbi:hypothetical protein KM043_018517 [Ampulex compressa]|nr:hypothetical protein KM043_018517 [Ampulex compressa]